MNFFPNSIRKMVFALMIIFSRTVNFLFSFPGVETPGYQNIAPKELKAFFSSPSGRSGWALNRCDRI